jgi:CRISPR-associated protein Cmr3
VSLDGADAAGITGKLVPLGGEGRGVWIKAGEEISLPGPAALAPGPDGVLRYTVVLLTPACFGDAPGDWPQPGGTIRDGSGEALPGRVVSACVGKPMPVGGWDSEARAPLPLRPLAPAGSVWFLEAGDGDVAAIHDRHAKGIGRATAWGFGLAAIGRWRKGEDADGG